MIELPHDIQPNDVHQWLEGGVFMALDGEEFRPAVLVGVPDHGTVRIVFVGDSDRTDVPYEAVRPHWPQCGALNMPGRFALYVQRLQRRQYRRTYNGRCVRVSVPGKWACLKALSARELQVDVNSPDFLLELFNPSYPEDFGAAMRALSERASIAVDPHTVLVGSAEPAVYYRGQAAGRIIGGEFRPECDDWTARRIRKIVGGQHASE